MHCTGSASCVRLRQDALRGKSSNYLESLRDERGGGEIGSGGTTPTGRRVQVIFEMILSHTMEDPAGAWTTTAGGRADIVQPGRGVENAWFQLRMSVNDPEVMVLNAEIATHVGWRAFGRAYRLLAATARPNYRLRSCRSGGINGVAPLKRLGNRFVLVAVML